MQPVLKGLPARKVCKVCRVFKAILALKELLVRKELLALLARKELQV